MLAIAARDLRSLFLSPLAWTILAVMQVVLAFLFLRQLELYVEIQPRLAGVSGAPGITAVVIAPVLRTAGVVFLLVAPMLTMRLVSEERQSGTLVLLMTSPVPATGIVLGKYLGILAFLLLAVAIVVLMPASLALGGTLDRGLFAAGVLGLALLVASFAAAGLFLSTVTEHPVLAAVSTFGLLLVLWSIDGQGDATRLDAVLGWLSLRAHADRLLRGVLDTRDLAYHALFVTTFLALAVRRIDAMRLGG